MKKPSGSVMRLATPLKAWAQRFAALGLIFTAFGLLLLGKADIQAVERLRSAITDAVAPILDFASRPVESVTDGVEEVLALAELREDNALLRQQNERLMEHYVRSRELAAENRILRDLLNLAPDPEASHVSARVIGDQGGAFVRSVLVNAGSRDGVKRGQVALSGSGVAGRVVEVGLRSARVLLLTDLNSRLPVLVGPTRDRAVLAGTNAELGDLLYLASNADIRVGDRVVTSGHGGLFPPGLPVGEVVASAEGPLKVRPLADWAHMEFLRLVDYELPGLIAPLEDEPPALAGSGL